MLLSIAISCEKETEFKFPNLKYLDSDVYVEIKKTCEAHWDLSNMIDSTFEVIPDRDEYSVLCDGFIDNILYHCWIRVDKYGQWINDGREKAG